jgi:hypothetical protein
MNKYKTQAEVICAYYAEKRRIEDSNDPLVKAFGYNGLRRFEDEMFSIFPNLPKGEKPRLRVRARTSK